MDTVEGHIRQLIGERLVERGADYQMLAVMGLWCSWCGSWEHALDACDSEITPQFKGLTAFLEGD